MILALCLLGTASSVVAFVSFRAWAWATGPIDTPPPRDVRVWARIFAPDLHPAIEELWPR